jgi:Phospholipase_D-nuclease N-terminal
VYSFGSFVGDLLTIIAFLIVFGVLIYVVVRIVKRTDLGVVGKFLWIAFLIFFPPLGLISYLISAGVRRQRLRKRSPTYLVPESTIPNSETFADAKLRVIAAGWPSGGDDLLGIELDTDARLAGSDLLDADSVEVERHAGNPEELIVARCTPAEDVNFEQAAAEIERIWVDLLRYRFFESHEFTTKEDRSVFQFVTQIERGGMYVTGTIELVRRRPL